MTTVRKFLFENDFDATQAAPRAVVRKAKPEPAAVVEPPPPPPPPEPTFSEAELSAAVADAKAAALKEGLTKGKAEGKAEAQAQIEAQIAAGLASIGSQVAAMSATLSLDRATLLSEAAGLALAMTRKMLPEFSRRGGLAEVEKTIEQCLVDQRRESRLNVRVPADLLPALQAKIGEIAADQHFEGRVNLLSDAGLNGASCRIEWADGGLERRADSVWQEVAAALDRCLATHGIVPTEMNEAKSIEPSGTPDGDSTDSDSAVG
ncbi:hypothetical protein [Dongia sp.]|uniref:hypothetical protein n=1 Tax=Dongia sp. TaxID=1977262 RepID=UPI0035AEB5CB